MFRLPLARARLELRALDMGDLEHHHRLFGDPSVVRYLSEAPPSRERAAAHLANRLDPDLPAEGEWLNLAVVHQGRFPGEVGASLRNTEHRQCEVGSSFMPEARGHGFATESAAAMVQLCFDHLDAHRVTARLDARNTASAAVAPRLGMRHEAHLREIEWVEGEYVDEAVFALIVNEWRR